MQIRDANVTDASGIAKVLVDVRKVVNRGLVPDSYLESLSYSDREQRWMLKLTQASEREFSVVATDAIGKVLGFAHAGPNTDPGSSFDAELYEIYVEANFQRKGLGKALLRKIAWKLSETGFKSLEVWVLTGNTNRGFYEAMGAEFVKSGTRLIGDRDCSVVSYGWKEIESLLGIIEQKQ